MKEKTMETLEELGIQRMLLPFLHLRPENEKLLQKRSLFFGRLRKILGLETALLSLNEREQTILSETLETLNRNRGGALEEMRGCLDRIKNVKSLTLFLQCMALIGKETALPILKEFLVHPDASVRRELFLLLLDFESQEAKTLVLELYQKDPDLNDLYELPLPQTGGEKQGETVHA